MFWDLVPASGCFLGGGEKKFSAKREKGHCRVGIVVQVQQIRGRSPKSFSKFLDMSQDLVVLVASFLFPARSFFPRSIVDNNAQF